MKRPLRILALSAALLASAPGFAKEELYVTGYVFENSDGSSTQVACRLEAGKCAVKTDDVDKTIDGNLQLLSFTDTYSSELHLNDDEGERVFTLYFSQSLPYEITYWKKAGTTRYDSRYSEKKSLALDAASLYKSALK